MSTGTVNGRSETGVRAGSRAALDVLLTDAAIEPGTVGRLVQPVTAARLAGGLARHPRRVARRVGGLGAGLTRIAVGGSEVAPPKGDRRFGDRAWRESWLFHRLMQAYLALEDAAEGLVEDAGLDWRNELRARFMVDNLLDAVAPTNLGFTNPEVLKETIDRGGANLVKGGRRFIRDASNGRLPAMVDTSRFQVGGNLAVSEGSIVLRTEVFELIQYRPTTGEVYETPLLIVPPTINKFYVVDLAPGRSLVEYLVAQGHQVFCISWRNPDSEHGHFDFDTYADAVLEARAAAAEIASRESINVMAACSGGIITAGALGHLADEGKLGDVSSLTLMVCRARQRAEGHGRGAGQQADRGRRGGRVGPPRLPLGRGAEQRVRVAATQRPDLELRRQQLPAGQGAAGVRHPVLEPGRRAHDGRTAPRLRDHGARQRARHPGRDARARDRGRPGQGRPRHATSSRAPTTTSSTGATRIARRSCSAATAGSCCPPAATSRR